MATCSSRYDQDAPFPTWETENDAMPTEAITTSNETGTGEPRQWPSGDSEEKSVSFLSSEASPIHFIAYRMRDIEAVEQVSIRNMARLFYVWIVIPQRDEEVLDRVYTRQQEIIDRFGEYEFDFYVLYRGDRELSELDSATMSQVFRKAK